MWMGNAQLFTDISHIMPSLQATDLSFLNQPRVEPTTNYLMVRDGSGVGTISTAETNYDFVHKRERTEKLPGHYSRLTSLNMSSDQLLQISY